MKMTFVLGVLAAMVAGCDGDYPAQSSQAESWSTAFRIVLPDEPKSWEKTAAEELEHYLGLCLGGNSLTVEGQGGVVFHVGDTAFARENGVSGCKDEEWCIKSFGHDVVLAGGGTRGTLYAVYNSSKQAPPALRHG